jgi:hypothetical protein
MSVPESVLGTPAPTVPADPNAPPSGDAAPAGDDWRVGLPEDIRGEKSLASFKSVADLAKSHVSAQKRLGGSIALPGKDAKPEELQALRSKLAEAGVIEAPPAKPEEYKATLAPREDGTPVDEQLMSAFRQRAHAAGMTDKQAQAMLDLYGENIAGAQLKIAGSRAETMAALEREWGGATPRQIALANRALSDADPDGELTRILVGTGLANHPAMIKHFARVGRERAEDDPTWAADMSTGSAEDARTQLAKIMADPNDLYHPQHKGRPGREERVAQVARLYEQIAVAG